MSFMHHTHQMSTWTELVTKYIEYNIKVFSKSSFLQQKGDFKPARTVSFVAHLLDNS